MAGLFPTEPCLRIRAGGHACRPQLWIVALLVLGLSLPAARALAAGSAAKVPPSRSEYLLFKLQRDLFTAQRDFRREQLSQTVYKQQLRLNPRQVFLLYTRSKAQAGKYFKAALHHLHQLERLHAGIPGSLEADLLVNYAWFIYPNNKPAFTFQLDVSDRTKVTNLLKAALAVDPRYPFAWIGLAYLDGLNLRANKDTARYAAALAQFDADTLQAVKLAPHNPNALFLRAGFLRLSGAASDQVCHLYFLAAKNLPEFSLRAVRYQTVVYQDTCQIASFYLRDHEANPEAASAIKMLPPLIPLLPGIVVRQFPSAQK